jgi:hypothetical protein
MSSNLRPPFGAAIKTLSPATEPLNSASITQVTEASGDQCSDGFINQRIKLSRHQCLKAPSGPVSVGRRERPFELRRRGMRMLLSDKDLRIVSEGEHRAWHPPRPESELAGQRTPITRPSTLRGSLRGAGALVLRGLGASRPWCFEALVLRGLGASRPWCFGTRTYRGLNSLVLLGLVLQRRGSSPPPRDGCRRFS